MSGPILPMIPMVSGGNGKVFFVLGVLAAIVIASKSSADPAKAAMAATVK